MKKIAGDVTWRTTCPSEESITIKGILPEDAHIQTWKWIDCTALGECVQNIFARQGRIWPPDIAYRPHIASSVFACYGRLCVDQAGDPVYTWANTSGVTIKGPLPYAGEWSLPIKIPLRVSTGILSLAEQGVMHVTVERVPISGPINHYFHLGHTANGTTYELLDTGRRDGSYHIVKWRPPLKGAIAHAEKT